jgi:hypothetical protein
MTVSTTNSRVAQNGDGSSVAFAGPYILAATDLKVYVGGVLKTLTTDYAVSSIGISNGCLVTFVTPPASGTGNVVFVRDPDQKQETKMPSNDPFPSKAVETALDKLTMLLQRCRDLLSRALVLSDSDTSTPASLPTLDQRRNNLLGFDANGNPIAVAPNSQDATSVATLLATRLPSFVGNALRFARVKSDETALEYRTQAQTLSDIGGMAKDGSTPLTGPLVMGAGANKVTIDPGSPSANRTQALQDKSGTVALTSDIRQIQPISASVASNALTLSTAATSLDFRSSTLGNGSITQGVVVPALSLVVPQSATLGTISGQAARLVLLVAYNAGNPVLCVANLAGGLNLDETTLISPTTISAGATSASIIYSASAVAANSPFRVVGCVDVTEAVAGTWATAPSNVQGAGGQALTALQSLGYGQTSQIVTGSRAAATTYYNTTGRPIAVSVTVTSAGNSCQAVLQVGSNVMSEQNFNLSSGALNVGGTLFAIVPPGASYIVTLSGYNINRWCELR